MNRFPTSIVGNTTLLFLLLFLYQAAFPQGGWALVRRTSATDLNTVFFVSSDKGWIGGDGGYLGYTADGGKSWDKLPLNTTANINEIYFRNDENGYILAGGRFFSTQNASQWNEQSILNAADFRGVSPELYSIRFADKKRGWIVGSLSKDEMVVDSLVFFTEDGGANWRRVKVPATEELIHLDFAGEARGWIAGANGIILATEDSGKSWVKQNSGTTGTIYNIDFRNQKEGWAVGEKGLILRTEDGGKTWQKVATSFKNTFLRVNFIDDKTGWIAGRGGMILRSDDKGKTWLKQESRVTDNLFGFFMDKKGGWAVGAKGVVLKYQK